jgi:rubrerythrin
MTGTVPVRVGLALPHLAADDTVSTLLDGMMEARIGPQRVEAPWSPHPSRLWDASQFLLDKSSLYRSADEQDQRAILALCARATLEEAYFIEKSGMAYAAKMVLLAESTEERALYSLFGADEATHLRAISAYLPDPHPASEDDPFLGLLSDIIENASRECSIFVIQVVLEGWGLTHYGDLARACRSEGLRQTLHAIVKDEARHHGSGVAMASGRRSARAKEEILEVLSRFLPMVQAGPQRVRAAIERATGGLTHPQRVELMTELGTEAHSQSRLELLERLMLKAGATDIAEPLQAKGAFRPLSAEEAA